MKFLLVSTLLLSSLSSFALELTLPKEGSYLITLASPEGCSPSLYSLSPKMFRKDFTELEVEISPVSNDRITTAVCRSGLNAVRGMVDVSRKTKVFIPSFGNSSEVMVKVEEITKTKLVK
ncbi:MAG TPA: hypothetical protein VNJ01_08805 [Bacteriovoracaceae bacterium]|nr:hypothetical protein [Bacteriovoracaceae bacterium]